METDCMSHPCCLTCATQPCPSLTWRLCSRLLAGRHSPACHRSPCCGRLISFKMWRIALEETAAASWKLCKSKHLKRKTWLCSGEFEMIGANFHIPCAWYLFHLFAFPLAKLQENICHGFKRFISFKAEGAGRPTHQWNHAILPALTRMG